ncbi:MAG: bifunctional phosphopantothenoylcysteine decarboxylase/phosphopantothenate--cysteine ligase CoaBC [Thermomicrobiales bacterium]
MPERRMERRGFEGANIVLGVTGGIAAYKAADLTSKLVQARADVRVVMTAGATQFVQPLTFQALSHQPVFSDVFAGWDAGGRGHVTLAADADVLLVAPTTANSIAKLAVGMVDDMLTAIALSTSAPLVIAPAMEHHMWHHPATQANVETLRQRGATIVAPETGYLASGASGDGRLAGGERIIAAVREALGRGGPLARTRIVITAGGTREALDPVRYLGNRSTGTMGLALVDAAIDLGANVTLIAGPTLAAMPAGVRVIRVESAQEMAEAVWSETSSADVLVMAAAVADFRPREMSSQKIKKSPGQDFLQLDLVRNPDIIAETRHPDLLKVGFAAETEQLEHFARQKAESKGLAMIVANDAVQTIGSVDSEAMFIFPEHPTVSLPLMPKSELAVRIMDMIVELRERAVDD